jgi:hypothetical protein
MKIRINQPKPLFCKASECSGWFVYGHRERIGILNYEEYRYLNKTIKQKEDENKLIHEADWIASRDLILLNLNKKSSLSLYILSIDEREGNGYIK